MEFRTVNKKGKLKYRSKDGNEYIIYPATDANLVQMSDGTDMEKAFENLKKLTSGIKFNITETDWTLDVDTEIYETVLNHELAVELEDFSISFYNNNESINLDYLIIDKNNMVIYSDEISNITVSIKQSIDVDISMPQEELDKIEKNKNDILANKNSIDGKANINHNHSAADITDLVIPEVDLTDYYNKAEVDEKVANANVDLSDYYNKAEVDNKIDNFQSFDENWGYITGDLSNSGIFPNPSNIIKKLFLDDKTLKYYVIFEYRDRIGNTTTKMIISDNTFHYGSFDSRESKYAKTKYFTNYSGSGVAGNNGAANHYLYYVEDGEWKLQYGKSAEVVDVDLKEINNSETTQATKFYCSNFNIPWNSLNKGKFVNIENAPSGIINVSIKKGTHDDTSFYKGVKGEIVMDTTEKRIVLQDGETIAGIPMAKLDEVNTISDDIKNLLIRVDNIENKNAEWQEQVGTNGFLTINNGLHNYVKDLIIKGKTIGGYNIETGHSDNIVSSGQAEGNKIIVKSVGKNLLNLTKEMIFLESAETGNFIVENQTITINQKGTGAGGWTTRFIKTTGFKPNSKYYGIAKVEENANLASFTIDGYNTVNSVQPIKLNGGQVGEKGFSIATGNDLSNNKLIRIAIQCNDNPKVKLKLCIVESTLATQYEPYQEDKTEILLPIEGGLKEWDNINLENGKATKGSDKFIFTGDGNLNIRKSADNTNLVDTTHFQFQSEEIGCKYGSLLICNRLPNVRIYGIDKIGINSVSANGNFAISVRKSDLETDDVAGFNKLLKKWYDEGNALEVVFEKLETPIIHNIEKMSLPQYAGTTHIIQENTIGGDISCKAKINLSAQNVDLKRENFVIKDAYNKLIDTIISADLDTSSSPEGSFVSKLKKLKL